MSVTLNRVTHGVHFDNGIRNAEYNEKPVGQTLGGTQQPLMPGSTTVSQALENVFPKDPTVSGLIAEAIAAAGDMPELRTASGFRAAAKRTIRLLHGRKGSAAQKASEEIENLLADTELLDQYRAALLES